MREVARAGNADLAAAGSDARLDEDEIVARMFALTETMGDYRTSMVIDYVNGAELEVEAILGNPVRRARELGLDVPTMATLYAVVAHADRVRRGCDSHAHGGGPGGCDEVGRFGRAWSGQLIKRGPSPATPGARRDRAPRLGGDDRREGQLFETTRPQA